MLGKKFTTFVFGTALLGAASVAAPVIAADTYKVDPAHASVYFQINHANWSNLLGRFNKLDGTFVLDEDNPGNSSVEIVIDAASVDTNHKKRDDDLRSPRFFNVVEFETITFKSTKIERKGDREGTVTGDLTIIGATRPVTFDFVWNLPGPNFFNPKATHTGFSAELVIKRSEWGLKTGLGGIGDDVTLFLEIEAIKQ
jgi:polyisoprenoid-binding protein YceI